MFGYNKREGTAEWKKNFTITFNITCYGDQIKKREMGTPNSKCGQIQPVKANPEGQTHMCLRKRCASGGLHKKQGVAWFGLPCVERDHDNETQTPYKQKNSR